MLLSETTRGNAFEAIDQMGKRQFRRVFNQKMHMVIFPVAINQDCFKVLADLCKDVAQGLMGSSSQNFPAVLGDKDQVDMELENAVSASAKFVCICHRPIA